MELGQFRMDVADSLGVKSMIRITQAAMGTQNTRFSTFFVGHPKAIGVVGRLGANEHQRSAQKRKNSGARHHFSEFFKSKNKKSNFRPKKLPTQTWVSITIKKQQPDFLPGRFIVQ